MLDFGVLWMNARNLSYISKFNNRKWTRLADDKLRTKRFFEQRWIPVPRTLGTIKTYDQVWSFDFWSLPTDEFIIKPARGSRWRGIYRVKYLPWDESQGEQLVQKPQTLWGRIQQTINQFLPWDPFQTSQFPTDRYKISWEIVSDVTFRRYLLPIK